MVRTRFAPSPTGFLHIGSVRTALFAWAFARHHGGQFILRIEDTDQVRSTDASAQAILDGLAYLGLDYDEGPFYQSQRLDRYRAVLAQLIQSGEAYYCYCSKARLDHLRATQEAKGEKPRYDGHCRPGPHFIVPTQTRQPVIRLKQPTTGVVTWEDGVKGRISVQNSELDDLILARADGMPTYNFCVVVDDSDMRITHVIRGDDHVNNTPRQINILKALKAPIPIYAHLPMIFNAAGQKLSKRRDPVNILEYGAEGFLPEALLNYLARLGWGHGDDEFFTLAQFCQWFDLKDVQAAPARFDRNKLLWLNAQYIRAMDDSKLKKAVLAHFLPTLPLKAEPSLEAVIALIKSRAQTLLALADQCGYFYERATPTQAMINAYLTPDALVLLERFYPVLEALPTWTLASLHQAFVDFCAQTKIPMKQLGMPLRVQVCGTDQTPSMDAVLYLIGQKATLARMQQPLLLNH